MPSEPQYITRPPEFAQSIIDASNAHIAVLEALLREYYDRGSPLRFTWDVLVQWQCDSCKQTALRPDAIQHTDACLRTRTAQALGIDTAKADNPPR